MKHTNLGRTGLKVSRLALGTMNFGPKTSEEENHAILDRALRSTYKSPWPLRRHRGLAVAKQPKSEAPHRVGMVEFS